MFECRQRLMKQCVPKPVEKRGKDHTKMPGPADYTPPDIIGGKGYDRIKRAPAYTFGQRTALPTLKPAYRANAPLLDVRGFNRKGKENIAQYSIAIRCNLPSLKHETPGPAQYTPKHPIKNPPSYSMLPAVPKYKEPWDMWTPGPNMYWPPVPGRKAPAFSIGNKTKSKSDSGSPGPGDYNPKFESALKNLPKYTFGHRTNLPSEKEMITPAPTTYCTNNLNLIKKSNPAPSFGIRHSPFLGKQSEFMKPSKLDLLNSDM